jgi:hypothetical protein
MAPLIGLIAGPILDMAGKIFDRVIPDKAAAEKAKLDFAATMQAQEFQLALEQIKVNLEEAKSTNWFVAGWRPAVGWIGAFGFGYATVLEPLLRFISQVVFSYAGAFPTLELGLLLTTLGGLLGLGTMRTVEKVKGGEANR